MPIFQDLDQPFLPRSSSEQDLDDDRTTNIRLRDSTAVEFIDGPPSTMFNWNGSRKLTSEVMPSNEAGAVTSSRAELIERIKRGESPTWVPKQPVCI